MDPSFVGTWTFREERPFPQDWVITVYADDRIVHFFRQSASARRIAAATMRASHEGKSKYRIRTEASAPGYLVSMSREGESLVIENSGNRAICRPLASTELPGWYAEAAERAVWR